MRSWLDFNILKSVEYTKPPGIDLVLPNQEWKCKEETESCLEIKYSVKIKVFGENTELLLNALDIQVDEAVSVLFFKAQIPGNIL